MSRPFLAISLAIFLAAACSSSKDAEGETSPKSEDVNPFEKASTDWAKAPLTEAISTSVDGIKFSLSLPKSLKREDKASDGTFPGYVHWTAPHIFMDPIFTVQVDDFPPKDLEDAKAKAGIRAEPTKVVGFGALDDGAFFVSILADSSEYLRVETWRQTAVGKSLRFAISLRRSDGIENADALRLWMESVAATFKTE